MSFKIVNLKLLILHFTLYSLLSAGAPDTLWTRTYGGDGQDLANSVLQTNDGGFIISGYTGSFGAGGWDVYLIRTDSNGDTLWTKTYGGTKHDWGNSIQHTFDGCFIITGVSRSFSDTCGDIYLIRTDANGDTLWTKTYGGDTVDIGCSSLQISDSGFLILGNTYSFGAGSRDIYLIRINSNGDTLWSRTHGGDENDGSCEFQKTIDNGFIITGSTRSFGADGIDVYLIRINNNGDTLWTKTYGGFASDIGSSIKQTNDSGFIIAGSTYSFGPAICDVYLIRTDLKGDTIWTKTYCKDTMSTNNGCSVIQTNDGGFIIAGNTHSSGTQDQDIYLIRTNLHGDTLWTKTLGNTLRDKAYSIQQTADGGYIIAGVTDTSAVGKSDVYLIRLDKETVGIQQEIPPYSLKKNNFIVSYNNGNISIRYTIPYSTSVKLEAYDIKGKLVKVITDKFMHKGSYSVNWESKRFGSGVYYLKLSAGENALIRKVLIVK